jgi:UDPglucose 6-dehydrogenase
VTQLFVIGLGPVGLATAVGLAGLGNDVTAMDIDADRIAQLRSSRAPFFEPGMDQAVREGLASGRLRFTTDARPPAGAEISVVCVGTPGDEDGMLSTRAVEAVVGDLLAAVPPDHVIVVRSTLPLHGPDRLARLAGVRPGGPFVVTNPEFMREGNALEDFRRPSRVVVGWLTPDDRPAAERVLALYAPLGVATLVADARSAALVKLATNVLLAAKIGFANELARVADAIGADAATVTAGIGLDPRIGPAFLRPGPGFGGSCLPEQADAIREATDRLGLPAPLLGSVATSNRVHQAELVRQLGAAVPGGLAGRRVAVLGLAFKAATDDVRQSPALAIAAGIRASGAHVVGHDPIAEATARAADPELDVAPGPAEAAAGAAAVVIATEWPEYATLDWPAMATVMAGDLVFDTRRIADGDAVRAAGLRYVALGRPPLALAVPVVPE